MTAFFFSHLLPLTLSGSAVVLAILPLSPLTRRLGSRWRYYSWAVALLLFLLPAALPIPLPARPQLAAQFLPAAAMAEAAGPPTAAALPAAASAPLPWHELTALLWLCGAAALLLQRAWAALRFSRALRRASAPVSDADTLALFAACRKELHVRRAVRLEYCSLAGTPMLVGLLRPRILLPERGCRSEELRLILLHELVHCHYGDLYYKLAALGVCILHWFNPLAWLAKRRIDALCEPACDERLAREMDAGERREYGMAILGAMGEPRLAPPLSTPFSFKKSEVKRRLSLMLCCKKSTKLLVTAGVCSALLLGFVGMSVSTLLFGGEVEATAPSRPARLLAPRPDRLAEELKSGITFDLEAGELRVTIPEELPEGWRWSIHAAGRAAMGDGGMSVHWLEARSAENAWEAGKTYAAPIGGKLLSYDVEFALLDGKGSELASGSLAWDDAEGPASDPSGAAIIGGADGPTAILVSTPPLTPPLDELIVNVPFGEGAGHKGVDYRAKAGDGVYAAADGTVTAAGWGGAYGYRTILDHGNGFETLYAHCGELYVKAGDMVTAGQRIAAAGSTGNAAGPCLHFEARLNGEAVDPPSWQAVTVPDLTGLTPAVALGRLRALGLTGSWTAGTASEGAAELSVSAQEPAAGSLVYKGGQVELAVRGEDPAAGAIHPGGSIFLGSSVD